MFSCFLTFVKIKFYFVLCLLKSISNTLNCKSIVSLFLCYFKMILNIVVQSCDNFQHFWTDIKISRHWIFVFNNFQQSWKVFIHFVCLNVRLSVTVFTLQMSPNVLKLIYDIHILHRMNSIENGFYRTNGSCTETDKTFSCIIAYGRKYLKPILACLYFNKCNEINKYHLDV